MTRPGTCRLNFNPQGWLNRWKLNAARKRARELLQALLPLLDLAQVQKMTTDLHARTSPVTSRRSRKPIPVPVIAGVGELTTMNPYLKRTECDGWFGAHFRGLTLVMRRAGPV